VDQVEIGGEASRAEISRPRTSMRRPRAHGPVLSGKINTDNGTSNGDSCGGPTVKQFHDQVDSVLP
jgi:hypothetical protein